MFGQVVLWVVVATIFFFFFINKKTEGNIIELKQVGVSLVKLPRSLLEFDQTARLYHSGPYISPVGYFFLQQMIMHFLLRA